MDDAPWLDEMLDDDELGILFSEDDEELRRGVRYLVHRAASDSDLESRLVELVDLALEYRNDATNATVWAIVILGELRSTLAIGTLARGLAAEHDEVLQDAAAVALLRIGAPALEAVMDTVEDDASAVVRRAAYPLLGWTAVLADDLLTDRVGEYLKSRLASERRLDAAEQATEELFSALAQLGRRDALALMKGVLEDDPFRGRNAAMQDAIDRLEENTTETPFVGTTPPWDERYGWLFADAREQVRVRRGPDAEDDELEESDAKSSDDGFYQGLGQRPDGGC